MGLLRDEELFVNITAPPAGVPYIEGVELPTDPYSKDSPVQSSSIDLHIGNVYLPGKKEDEVGGIQNPRFDVELKTGETAVVTTREILHLPGDVAGLGFPPSRVSFKGLLMTNPGHVDPGYDGVMRFTVINMAKENYRLTRGAEIVTLLLFRMDKAAHSSWRKRHPEGSSLPGQAAINRLSKDFVDVERRAKSIARKHGAKVSVFIAGALTLLTTFLGLVSSGHLFRNADIEDLKKRQEIVDYDLKNRVDVERKLQDFENRLKDLETQLNAISERSRTRALENKAPNPSGKQP